MQDKLARCEAGRPVAPGHALGGCEGSDRRVVVAEPAADLKPS
jgi:hypothetical protein